MPETHVGTLTVATWNIHSCVGMDGQFDPDRIAQALNRLDADIVALQEVGWHRRGQRNLDQFDYLSRATSYVSHAGPTRHNERAHYGNAIFARLPVIEARQIDISVPGREPRGAIDADVMVHGRVLRVVAAHLGLGSAERGHQVAQLLRIIGQQPDRPTLFMGDLNEWYPRSPRIAQLEAHFHSWAAPRSFPARMPTLRLDRIFATRHIRLYEAGRVLNPVTRVASDHLPVKARVTFVD